MTICGQTSWNTRNENKLRALYDHIGAPFVLNLPPSIPASLREHICKSTWIQDTRFKYLTHEETLQALATFYGLELRNTTTTDADGTVARGYTFEFEGETYGAVAQCEITSPTFQNLCRSVQLLVELISHGKTKEEWDADEHDRNERLSQDISAFVPTDALQH